MELSKNNRIKNELERISVFFEEIDGNKKAIISPLLQNAAFMKVTLEDLQEAVNSEGVTDKYQNGANQYGVKQSATLQSYNALIKNYASVIKALSLYLPAERKNTLPSPWAWTPREKTEEEREAERQRDEEQIRKANEAIARAAELQRQDRENLAKNPC